ncbi:NPFF1 protein, partial [Acromyrmex insinuator]
MRSRNSFVMSILMYIVQNEYKGSPGETAKQNAVMARTQIDFVDQDTTRTSSDQNTIPYEISNNESYMNNETLLYNVSFNEDYIFDRTDVKVIFITLYTIVFVCCFFGNLMVIFVVTFSRRLRSITNFFLANLAVADFCVGIFCVYQTLTNYLMNSWQLGDFLCKVYMFVHALSYTASILILVVVCTERYLAIVHPIKCRSMLTRRRLRMVIGVVWILAAVYASPRFFYVETISNRLNSGDVDIICIANIKKHNKNVLDVVNLVLLYLFFFVIFFSKASTQIKWNHQKTDVASDKTLHDSEENTEEPPELSSLEQYRSITWYLEKYSPASDLDKLR